MKTENKKAGARYLESDKAPVAFFCAEYGIDDESLYAGGLGVLAGDIMLEAGDEGMPIVGLGMKYAATKTRENGYELVTSGGKPVFVEIPIESRTVRAQAWMRRFGPNTVLFLLDADVEGNSDEDRKPGTVYDQHFYTRLRQQMMIGIGGVRLLKSLGIEPAVFHLNEGNMAFAAFAVMAEHFSEEICSDPKRLIDAAKSKVVASKHTILPAGAEIPFEELWRHVGEYCVSHGIRREFVADLGAHNGDPDIFSATKFLLSLSGRANGVSLIHTVAEKEKHPDSELIPITNGVYVKRWQDASWREAGDVSDLDPETMWEVKRKLRAAFLSEVERLSGTRLDPDVCTIVWTRRFVPYKRPLALFADLARLKAILGNARAPVQFVISGKVYGPDTESSAIAERIRAIASDAGFRGKIAFVPGYSLSMARLFVSGADVWLNTPIRGKEACGTSGMKAGLNGALTLSVSDGWVDEVDWKGAGWILPDDDISNALYDILEREVLPEFSRKNAKGVPEEWVRRMKKTMEIVTSRYGAERMMKDYREKLYRTG